MASDSVWKHDDDEGCVGSCDDWRFGSFLSFWVHVRMIGYLRST
jgi:hypothetical protein